MKRQVARMGQRTFLLLMAMSMFVALGPAMALAQTSGGGANDANYGDRAGDWALDNIKSPWKAAVAAGALAFLFPGARKIGIIVGYVVAVVITGMFVFAGGSVETMVTTIAHKIAGTS